MSEYQKAF